MHVYVFEAAVYKQYFSVIGHAINTVSVMSWKSTGIEIRAILCTGIKFVYSISSIFSHTTADVPNQSKCACNLFHFTHANMWTSSRWFYVLRSTEQPQLALCCNQWHLSLLLYFASMPLPLQMICCYILAYLSLLNLQPSAHDQTFNW